MERDVPTNELRSAFNLITEDELAAMLEVKPSTLADWRQANKGPHSVKLAKTVFYRKEDVEEWIKENVTITKRT